MTSYVSLPMYAANIDERLRLIAGKCGKCGALAYPQRQVCSGCGHSSFTDTPLSGRGTLYSFTVIARGGAPAEFDDQQTMTGDLICGVVALDEGPRIMVQIADAEADALEIGTRLRAVIRRLYDQEDILRYGAKFVPADSHGE